MRRLTLGPRTVAAIGVILCFLVASLFSGCILDDANVQKIFEAGPCVYYAGSPGTKTIIYHRVNDPKGTFVHKTVQVFTPSDSVIDLNAGLHDPKADPNALCDQIQTVTSN